MNYNIQYQKDNIKRFYLKVNVKTEQDILSKLKSQSNYNKYIKDLIRKDLRD